MCEKRAKAEWTGHSPTMYKGEWILIVDGVDVSKYIPYPFAPMNTYKQYRKLCDINSCDECVEENGEYVQYYYDGMESDEWVLENMDWLRKITEDEFLWYDIFDAINEADWQYEGAWKITARWSGEFPKLCDGEWSLLTDDFDEAYLMPDPHAPMNTYKEYKREYYDENHCKCVEFYFDGLKRDEWIEKNFEWLEQISEEEEDHVRIYNEVNRWDWRHESCGGCFGHERVTANWSGTKSWLYNGDWTLVVDGVDVSEHIPDRFRPMYTYSRRVCAGLPVDGWIERNSYWLCKITEDKYLQKEIYHAINEQDWTWHECLDALPTGVMVDWSGNFPRYCSGYWTLIVGKKDVSRYIPDPSKPMNTYKQYCEWMLYESDRYYYDGLKCDDWIQENEDWLCKITRDEDLQKDIYDALNQFDWRYNSCGGCI